MENDNLEWRQSYSYRKSVITDGIVVGKDKLDRYTKYDFDIGVTMKSSSNKESMWSTVIDKEEIVTTTTMNPCNNVLSPKATVFSKALKILVLYQLKMRYQMKKVTKTMKI